MGKVIFIEIGTDEDDIMSASDLKLYLEDVFTPTYIDVDIQNLDLET